MAERGTLHLAVQESESVDLPDADVRYLFKTAALEWTVGKLRRIPRCFKRPHITDALHGDMKPSLGMFAVHVMTRKSRHWM